MTATELMDQQTNPIPSTNQRLNFRNHNNNNALKLNEFWSSPVKLVVSNGSGSGNVSPPQSVNHQVEDSVSPASMAAAAAAAANFLTVQQQNQLMSSMAAFAALQQQQQQQQQTSSTPTADGTEYGGNVSAGTPSPISPERLTEKLVSDLQQIQSRSTPNTVFNERTLEECWSTLQRIFMHKSAMQMHAARGMTTTGRSMLTSAVNTGAVVAAGGVSGPVAIPGPHEIKPHQCQQCLKSFSSNHQLVQHIRVHTGEKPYKCTYCERRFKQLSHVQQHTRLHTGERPYKCHLTDCGRAFIQLSNLQQHLRNHDAQMERAKNRPFHCNICGKGFATESSLRTHTSKCIGRLQQHAAMIGAPSPTTCPLCQKIFLGADMLTEHMKIAHKDPNTSGVARWLHALSFNTFSESLHSPTEPSTSTVGTPISDTTSSTPMTTASLMTTTHSPSGTITSMLMDPYLAKRRNANHTCSVCGKHYVNEGSLRKHLACHPEATQLSNSLRMWPCSVCQAVFTHESGLLSHMDHMRMDPKHQFAAQYVLSRAAAERRERDTIIAAVSASGAAGLLNLAPNSSPICMSPSAQSDTSSNTGRISPATSETGITANNNNTTCAKLSEILRNSTVSNGCDLTDANTNQAAAVVQVAAANLAAVARRMQQSSAVTNLPITSTHSETLNALNAMRNSIMIDSSPTSCTANEINNLRMHQQAEALLRSQAEAALRLAVSQAAAAVVNQPATSSSVSSPFYSQSQLTTPQHQQQQQQQQHHQNQHTISTELNEALRYQEHRLEQALRLHNSEPRTLNFSLANAVAIVSTTTANQET